jgi:hypothetical protein
MPLATPVYQICFANPDVLRSGAGEYPPGHDALFHIERSKNASIVQYDALLDSNGDLLAKEPVDGYWIRHAEQGEVATLTWVQKKFAYGYKVKLIPQTTRPGWTWLQKSAAASIFCVSVKTTGQSQQSMEWTVTCTGFSFTQLEKDLPPGLTVFNTMIRSRVMVWHFFEAVVLSRTKPSNMPLKKVLRALAGNSQRMFHLEMRPL